MAYDFHYTPTGTGVISGKEVLEQTEDAINDLGNTAISGVQEALDKAEQALTNSENAVDDAQTALNTANNAEGVAIQAQTDVGNLSGTVTNIGNRVTTAEGNISNLQGRMTTAEGNITNLQGRMTTAETNIGNLQTAVSTAQATANSAQQTATTARQQSYVFRYSGTAVVPNSTIAYSTIDNTDNIKSGDKILDVDGKLFEITAVDTTNETVTVGSALIDLALDANVVHTRGNETVGGVKTFSGDTYVKNIVSTNEVESQSSSSSAVLPIIVTVTYTDQSPSQSVRLNLRITANGDKSLYPHENNQYALGLTSRKWSEVHGVTYYYGSSDTEFSQKFVTTDTNQDVAGQKTLVNLLPLKGEYLGTEASNNGRSLLYFLANRDTQNQSGIFLTKFRQNKAQGSMSGNDVAYLSFDCLENSVRTNNGLRINFLNFVNDIPQQFVLWSGVTERLLGTASASWSDVYTNKINSLEPSALGMPDLSNGIDISSYLNTGSSTNDSYTASVNGYISIIFSSSTACGCYVYNYTDGVFQCSNSITDSTYTNVCGVFVPILRNQTLNISSRATENIVSAKFFPCQGNV